MKKITLLFAAIVSAMTAYAQSFSATYTFDSVTTTSGITDPTPVPTATGITFGSFSATGTPPNPNASLRFCFTNWPLGATASSDVYASHTGSINTSEYLSVTVAPAGPYTMSLTGISFKVQRSGTGIRTYAVRSSADGYAADLPSTISPANPNLSVQPGDIFYWNFDATTSGQNGSRITLSGPSFTNISSPVTFRFYAWNAEATGGTFSIDNVVISGSALPPATLTSNFTNTTACLGDSTFFTNTSAGPYPITSYDWSFGDGSPHGTAMNVAHLYSSSGTYVVILTVTDSLGNSNAHTALVTVNPKPGAGFSAPSSACANSPVQFLDASGITSGSISSWSWNFGEPASGAADTSTLQNPQHIYTSGGIHNVTEIVTSAAGCRDTANVSLTIDSIGASYTSTVSGPVVSFTTSVAGGVAPFTFSWDFGDGGTSTAANPVYTYATPGSYTACLTVMDVNGCMDSTCHSLSIITTGIAEREDGAIQITPNPSDNGLFRLTAGKQETAITVYNVVGSIVLSKKITGTVTLDLSSQPPGTYFLRMQNGSAVSTEKLIISK